MCQNIVFDRPAGRATCLTFTTYWPLWSETLMLQRDLLKVFTSVYDSDLTWF